jgi:hypothetical protein
MVYTFLADVFTVNILFESKKFIHIGISFSKCIFLGDEKFLLIWVKK